MTTADPLTPELIQSLTAADGLAFCQFLRQLYFEELQSGHIAAGDAAGRQEMLARAAQLGLLRPSAQHFRLTDIGFEISNVAKEYANWVDGGRALPDGVPATLFNGARVLDVGCSFGRQMLGFSLRGASVWGIDFQHTYLRLSRPFAHLQGLPPLRVARARAEQLPFGPEHFDVVFCRLVVNYVADIDATLAEFSRVLKPSGTLVLIIEPLSAPLRLLRTSRWIGNARTIAFLLFGLLNTCLVECGGRQMVLRRQGRLHAQHSPAWPTGRWFARRLAARGFVAYRGETVQDPQRPELFLAIRRSR